ncbi:hypothetical protein [Deinococcus knuensis]|uniref:Uncharacterized protein n=1 Tax=Deinococcus knuensis TaxID=1837380 RepID=A0ABQ2SZ56_9DEIO|nr:hypothetical protein [Deinococcus knuensis]GGS44747.1 hypothetical protein GCM10008961_39310 [Deinococcus knuensis]
MNQRYLPTFAILALAWLVLIYLPGQQRARQGPQFDTLTFTATCRLAVKNQLKAPATAQFPGLTSDQVQVSGGRGTLRGVVDAQNSFGAMLRTGFTCTGTEQRVTATLN